MTNPLPSLIGLNRQQLAKVLARIGVPAKQIPLRVSQLWNWIYVRGKTEFSEMLNLGTALTSALAETVSIARPEIVREQISTDGTRKWLLRYPPSELFPDPVEVETVYIPEPDRGTVCVSSQVGCSLTCTFCHTGTQKMVRNLTAGEILGQIMLVRDRLEDYPNQNHTPQTMTDLKGRKVTNIVLMGMGEPLFNFENVKSGLLIALDDQGLDLSRRRITLSTSGVVPGIYRTGEEIKIMLAISLHAVTDQLRDELVPINRKYPLSELLKACRHYPGLSNSRRITFEYVLLKDVNDSLADARELVRLLADIPAKINLIPFNPWPGSIHECSDTNTIDQFGSYLKQRGYVTPIRTPRGQDIMAACGQLKSESLKNAMLQ